MLYTAKLARKLKLNSLQLKKVRVSLLKLGLPHLSTSQCTAVIPVICDTSSDIWHSLIPTLDVIIEAVGGTANMKVVSASIREAVISAAQRLRPSHAPKIAYIYTSGTWVHGENRSEIVTDSTPITNPPELVAWRPPQEQLTITDTTLNGIVVRPALLYGRSGSILETLFKQATVDKKVTWPGTPGGKLALIHTDDLANLYVRVAEGASIAGGKIFDAANSISEDVDAFLKKLSIIVGLGGEYEYRSPENRESLPLNDGL